ncbi:MAG TPA: haloacid dehalogenase type II [Ktedonobacterales bacterium]|jgi:2-haloacid dehalogenase|nr:haloacid dehalogenase type II [Ktedonobacterales bacterium]
MRRVCVFDVNETLLDLASLDTYFQRAFGDAAARREWFSLMLQYAFALTAIGDYRTFGEHGQAALTTLMARHAVSLSADEQRAILMALRVAPAHADVPEGLRRLSDAGFRLVALTNSTMEVAEQQLANAGVRSLFEHVFSADTVRRLKPAAEPYHMVADALGVAIGQTRLIAAHGWDISGALAVGASAAFIARPGAYLIPGMPEPDIVGSDLPAVAERIVALEGEA